MSLKDWIPNDDLGLFGTRREYKLNLPNGLILYGDPLCPDTRHRPWRERLFSLPWRPFKTSEATMMAYMIDNQVIVSIKTFLKIERHEMDVTKVLEVLK